MLQNDTNAIGHPTTDAIVADYFCKDALAVECGCRMNVQFPAPGVDALIVAQYRGPRLPEGATELPPGAKLEFWLVKEI